MAMLGNRNLAQELGKKAVSSPFLTSPTPSSRYLPFVQHPVSMESTSSAKYNQHGCCVLPGTHITFSLYLLRKFHLFLILLLELISVIEIRFMKGYTEKCDRSILFFIKDFAKLISFPFFLNTQILIV